MIYDAVIVGGGAAGLIAAFAAAQEGANVILLEKNDKIGKKLYITGKGRCNITNDADIKNFFDNIIRNPKFLMSAFNKLSNRQLIELIEQNGLKTKTERGGRVFPQSDKSSDVIAVFRKMLKNTGVKIRLNQTVKSIEKDKNIFTIKTTDNEYLSKKVVIATGGLTYPATGSTGDGYLFAEKFGHTINKLYPALVPLVEKGDLCSKMQGLTLNNVGFKLLLDEKILYEGMGELLFTHFGLSGPQALTASCYLYGINDIKNKKLKAQIDLKPALTNEQSKRRIVRDLDGNSNKQLKTYLKELLPSKMILPFLEKANLEETLPLNGLTRENRERLINTLKSFNIDLKGLGRFEEAIITAGGIKVNEINPSTMESKIIEGLYFAGEIIDVSALTGGFNLQIAFSTGYTAGRMLSTKI